MTDEHRQHLEDATATQALWNLQLRADILSRYGGWPTRKFDPSDLDALHPVETPVGDLVLGYELEPDTLRPRRDLAAVNRIIDGLLTGWALADWWTSPSGWLDWSIPLDVVDSGEMDAVVTAAEQTRTNW